MNKKKFQTYINNYRRRIGKFLKPGVGLACNIYSTVDDAAILEFVIGHETENEDKYHSESISLGEALSKIEQRAFSGNLANGKFLGTNTILEPNRIIYIKDSSMKEWTDAAAEKDIRSLFINSIGAES